MVLSLVMHDPGKVSSHLDLETIILDVLHNSVVLSNVVEMKHFEALR